MPRFPVASYKLASMAKLNNTFISDNSFDIQKYLTTDFARRFGRAEENACLNGTGVKQPTGILTAEPNVTVTGAISYDDIVKLYFSLEDEYRQNAIFIMNDTTVMALRTLKDTSGNYLWKDSAIFEKAVAISRYMPTGCVVFGDLSYYWIIERQPFHVKVLTELYANRGQTGYIVFERIDGRLINSDAVKVLASK